MKIALLHMEEIPTLFMLEKAARKAGFKPSVIHLRNLRFFVNGPEMDIRAENISLKTFDCIFIRGFWDYQNEVSLLGKFCARYKIPLYDTAIVTNPIISKNDDMLLLGSAGLPLIRTLFLEDRYGLDILLKTFDFPMVAKETRGKRGFDVYLLKNKKQLIQFLREKMRLGKSLDAKTYQFQEYIPADYDVRVLVMGGKVLGAIERRSSDPNDFRHNISLGGTARQIPVTPEMRRMALKAAQILNFQFAGVDFITNKYTGKMYLLEVNRSPGFEGFMKATGIDVPFELMKMFLRFMRKNLQSKRS